MLLEFLIIEYACASKTNKKQISHIEIILFKQKCYINIRWSLHKVIYKHFSLSRHNNNIHCTCIQCQLYKPVNQYNLYWFTCLYNWQTWIVIDISMTRKYIYIFHLIALEYFYSIFKPEARDSETNHEMDAS